MRNKEQQSKYFHQWYLKNKERNAERGKKWLKTPKGIHWSLTHYISIKVPPELRFWNMVDIREENECWNWLGLKYPLGYGRFSHKKDKYAHRFSYIVNKGKIPKGMCVCHSCDNPSCVNPNHLWIGTMGDNMRDRDLKGRDRWTKQKLDLCINNLVVV